MFTGTLCKSCTSANICNNLPTTYSGNHSCVFITTIRVYLFKCGRNLNNRKYFWKKSGILFVKNLFYCQRSSDPECSVLVCYIGLLALYRRLHNLKCSVMHGSYVPLIIPTYSGYSHASVVAVADCHSVLYNIRWPN